MIVTGTSAELGDNVSELDATVEGDEIEVAFNARYLIDALSVVGTPEIVLETSTASSPGVHSTRERRRLLVRGHAHAHHPLTTRLG